ncbi:MAG: glutathione peroxidase, partial [Betaproteobacteria bacterium]|nr:glutathione peroxidase [Betaproteobacteria bacterium]
MRLFPIVVAIACFGGLALNAQAANTQALAATTPQAASGTCPTLLNQTVPRLQDDKAIDLCQYAGKVVLVVNTASYCGFTPQYKGLEAMYKKYGPEGLVVLGFPS